MFPKRAAYESLRSVGLDLVENDALRTRIATFYELVIPRTKEYEALSEAGRIRATDAGIAAGLAFAGAPAPVQQQPLTGNESKPGDPLYGLTIEIAPLTPMAPSDPQAFQADTGVHVAFRVAFARQTTSNVYYRQLIGEADGLLQDLARELER